MRLNPTANDQYIWSILPEKRKEYAELFSKNLSQHSINGYKTLCEGVGIVFEALLANPTNANAIENVTSVITLTRGVNNISNG